MHSHKLSLALVLLPVVALALGGCDKKESGPAVTCEQAIPHMNQLIVAEAPEADRAKATADLAAELPKTIAECKTKNMSADGMKCLMAAKTTNDFGNCK